jgi:hypothetical protein
MIGQPFLFDSNFLLYLLVGMVIGLFIYYISKSSLMPLTKVYTLIFLILSLLFSTASIAQDGKLLSPKKMQKDLDELLFTLEAHPDPYQKISETDFNNLVDSVRQNLSKEIDFIDFYKNLSLITASIHDGHTSLHLPEHWLKNARKEYGAFPLEMYLTNENELFLIKDLGESTIPLGSQILSIEGVSIKDFIKNISPYISFEIEPFRNVMIENNLETYLYLMFKKSNDLTFTYFQKDTLTTKVNNIDYKNWKKQQKSDREEREKKIMQGKPYDYTLLKPGVGMINIFSFSVSNIDSYNIFLNKTFKNIRKDSVHSLIIDVRGNYGGSPQVSSELFHYIHDGYFKTMAKSSMKVSSPYRKYFHKMHPQLKNPNYNINFLRSRFFIDIESVLYNKLDTYVEEASLYNEEPVEENFEYTGDTYLLTNRISYSAASSFASTFQCYNMGLIIGEPTGGTKIFRANAMYDKLAKYNMIIAVSTAKKSTACYNEEDEPVTPNIEVTPSVIDRIHEADSQLNYTLMYINKLQKNKSGL